MSKRRKGSPHPNAWKDFVRNNPDRFPNNNPLGQPKLPDQRLSKAAEHLLHQSIKPKRPKKSWRGTMPTGKIEGKSWRLIFSRDLGLDRRDQFHIPTEPPAPAGKPAAVTPKPGGPEIGSAHPGPSPAPLYGFAAMSCPTGDGSPQPGQSVPIVSSPARSGFGGLSQGCGESLSSPSESGKT